MELRKHIAINGLENILKSIFTNLHGIDFLSVKYDRELEQLNIIENMTSDIDGLWHLGIGTMPMLFKAVSSQNEIIELNKLLLSNQIYFDDKYNENKLKNIDFWNGDGFKIERTLIDDIIVLVVTSASVTQKSFQIFNKTDLAKEANNSLNWIEGFDLVYDSSSISKKDKELSTFINVPILYTGDVDYILIPVHNHETAKIIIDRIIINNGAHHSFKQEDISQYNELTYLGYAFIIGYLPESNVVRINKLVDKTTDDSNKSSSCIHPLSKKLKACINGFENIVYYGLASSYLDGRFCAKEDDASVIEAYFKHPSIAINIFKNIIFLYNDEDEFLSINKASIVELFNREPEDVITFDVKNKFRFDLSKFKSYYQLKLYPPGGIYGSWDELNEDDYFGLTPEVKFSQFSQELKTKNILIYNNETQ